MVNSFCKYATSVLRATYDVNVHQKRVKHKPTVKCDRNFEAVRMHGVRSSTLQLGCGYYISGCLTDSGTIAAHYEYSPFGEISAQSGVPRHSTSGATTGDLADSFIHRFSTKPWCSITVLNECEYRKYSPALGRWLSRDPIGVEAFRGPIFSNLQERACKKCCCR